MVRLAPIVQLFVEVLGVETVQDRIVAHTECVARRVAVEQPDQSVTDIRTELCLVCLCCAGAVRRCPAVILRLVGEKAGQLPAKAFGKTAVVLLVRFLDEGIHHDGIEGVGVGGTVLAIDTVVFGHIGRRAGQTNVTAVGFGVAGEGRRIVGIANAVLQILRQKFFFS